MNTANINISNNYYNSLYTFFSFFPKKNAFFPIQDTFFRIFWSFFVNKATNNSNSHAFLPQKRICFRHIMYNPDTRVFYENI